jgi:hypothetical protein
MSEKAMADDRSNRGCPDWQRIGVKLEHELRDRPEKFGVGGHQLCAADANAGNLAADVEKRLRASCR